MTAVVVTDPSGWGMVIGGAATVLAAGALRAYVAVRRPWWWQGGSHGR